MAYILYSLLFATSIYVQSVRGSKNLNEISSGPYECELDGFSLCPGTKELSSIKFVPSIKPDKNNSQRLQLNYTIYKELYFESVQITTSRYHDRRDRLFLFSIKKPCNHFLFKAILLQQGVLRSAKDCIVKKGSFFFDWNIDDIMKAIVGQHSVYGKFTVTITLQSKKGLPQVCLMIDSFIVKKKKFMS